MRTPKQQAASRANAARSTGPKTAAGKHISSGNAISHGLLAKTTVIHGESLELFHQTLRAYIQRIGPRDVLEAEALEEMCSAAWRLRRLWTIEREALDLELDTQTAGDVPECMVRAFDSLARNSPHFLLLHRYETRLHNIIQRSLHRIFLLRKCGVRNEAGQVVEITPPPPSDPPAIDSPVPVCNYSDI
ncbi:MAG: hypothetical protein HY822_08990 [Acidobacteria bacterium]|nr:hypothetical protein [Acidobacteriota bacterium]